jgi:hypothetical protein
MLTFNWGIFWALLAAFAVRGYYRFLIHRTKTEPDFSALQLLWGAVFPVLLILILAVVYRSALALLPIGLWAAFSADKDGAPALILATLFTLSIIGLVGRIAWKESGRTARDRMKNYPHVTVAFVLLSLFAALSVQAQTKDLYSNTGKIVRTTMAHSTFDRPKQ